MSVSSTSHMTSLLSPPRIGSGQTNTGWRTQSDALPGAWLVLEPSNPHSGSPAPSARTFVLERSLAVGSLPSIQMYSALNGIRGSPPLLCHGLAACVGLTALSARRPLP